MPSEPPFPVALPNALTRETLRKSMAEYHTLVDGGRREIYRIES